MATGYKAVRYRFSRKVAAEIRAFFGLRHAATPTMQILDTFADIRMDDTDQDGWTVRNPVTGHYRCFINLEMPRNRTRWTMAHEIGHILLGHIQDVSLDGVPDDVLNVMEREANVFAEELLMPWEFFEGHALRNLPEWAEHMEVSQEACAWRLLQIPRVYPSSGRQRLGLTDSDFTLLMAQCAAAVIGTKAIV